MNAFRLSMSFQDNRVRLNRCRSSELKNILIVGNIKIVN